MKFNMDTQYVGVASCSYDNICTNYANDKGKKVRVSK